MADVSQERWSRFSFPLVAAALLTGAVLRFVLEPLTGLYAGYLFFLPAVVFGAALGGAPAALIAALVGTLLGLIAAGRDGLSGRDLLLGGIFCLNGFFITAIGGVSYRRHAQTLSTAQELRLREAQLTSILDTVPDAIIVFDQVGTITSFSAAAERMFQWRSDEIVGTSVSRLMPKAYIRGNDGCPVIEVDIYEKDIFRRGRSVIGQRKDKTLFPIQLSVGDVDAIPPLHTAFVTDLTAQKESQAKVEGLQAELAHTSRLSAMGEMAAALAHELNQPLAAIVNYHGGLTRILENSRKVSPVTLLPPLQKAAAQAIRAGEIVHGIQSFVSKRAGKRETASLDTLVSEACTLALVGVPTKFAVRIQVVAGLKPVVVDKIQIQQVLLNLVRNALEAMEKDAEGEVLIRGHDNTENATEISVSDTGFGVPPVIGDNLFKPFVTSKPDGMGLGLSICRTIVEAHGGRIWMEPNSPKGSIFRFTLPTGRGPE